MAAGAGTRSEASDADVSEMKAPIIFIHYSDSSYLKYTLQSAQLFNPDKRVILLGDETNAHYKNKGIEHFSYDDYRSGEEIEVFDKVYRFIAGKHHGGHKWTNFVFRRWFIIHNFISTNNIGRFWTWDSDNVILTSLSAQEYKFMNFDCTEQCSGICMNGFVTNMKVVKGYVDKINELFQREEYVEKQKEEFETFPYYAFTEMRAYKAYKDESGIRRIRLNSIIDGETFDDCICSPDEYETYDHKMRGRTLKKIYMGKDGNIFTFHIPSQQLVKLNSINLSWVPDYVFDNIFRHSKRKVKMRKANVYCKDDMAILKLNEHFSERWKRRFVGVIKRLWHGVCGRSVEVRKWIRL